MDLKKEFVQVYGYCVEDGVTGDLWSRVSTTHIRMSDIRRFAVYNTFGQLATSNGRSIFHTHVQDDKDVSDHSWKNFCIGLCTSTSFSCKCEKMAYSFNQCTCDFSMVLPLVEVWTKTGKYFVAGEDRFRFVERK